MNVSQSSKTAEYMAFFRALESARPPRRRVISDPFAASFLRPNLRCAVRLANVPGLGWLIERYVDHRLPGARTSAIARTRIIDDSCAHAVRDSIRQIVILGAGFDCRAYRLKETASSTVFEVDHPATRALKQKHLEKILPVIPENVRFAVIDFNRKSLPEVLNDNGFDTAAPTLFLWEGVTNYLTEEAVDAVLRYAGRCAYGSRIIFTYVHRGVLDGTVEFYGGSRIRRDVAALGEPWTFGFDPEKLSDFLRERNLVLDDDAGAQDYRLECFGPDSTRMKGYDFYHLAMAHVPERCSTDA